uniref:UPAR/Ly6 domain-containing protein n=1 Tax=Oryzias sinensis TaxID=183150 RepID=A0A8C8DH74_9TELE
NICLNIGFKLLYKFILILFVVLLGDTLKCYECIPDNLGNCNETQRECPLQNHQCGASRLNTYIGGSKIHNLNGKGCALPEQCDEASVNFGLSKTWINTQCCNSNLCNSQSVPGNTHSVHCNELDCLNPCAILCTLTLGVGSSRPTRQCAQPFYFNDL